MPTRRTVFAAAVLAFAGTLAGCSSSRTFVLEPAVTRMPHTTVHVQRAVSTVPVDDAMAKTFETKLAEKLKAEANITATPGSDLVLQYRFVLFDTGSSAVRVGAGLASLAGSPFYGLGDGSLGVEVTYLDQHGKTVGRILVDGPISGAFASPEGGLSVAASSIAKYTKTSFVDSPNVGIGGESLARQ